jgi:hypothetical protein
MNEILTKLDSPPRPVRFRAVDDGWRQWIAENRLRDCTAESVIATMISAGVHPHDAKIAVTQMESNPVYLAARRHQELLRKLESVVANQQRLWQSAPGYATIEKRKSVPADEFVERYVRGSRPVVLTDVTADWPAMKRWSANFLKEKFGDLSVEIQAGRNDDRRYEENKLDHRQTQRFGDFIDRVLSGGPTNDYYMTANNEALRQPGLAPLLDDIGSLPEICDRAELARSSSFWFGPAGTVTPLHHDTLMLFHTQVVGRKRWRFVSPLETPKLHNFNGVFSPIDVDNPDLSRYPLFADVTMLEVVVEPGETVFLPLGWWHQVTSLDVSLSFSYSNLDVSNHFTYANPTMSDW